MSDWKRYLLPGLMSVGGALLGIAMQAKSDKNTEELVRTAARQATKSEFDRLARQKHGGPRHNC